MDDYKDIINLSRPISKKHIPMKLSDRAAQFGAFAALTGFKGEIEETGRQTETRIELSEEERGILNIKINKIKENIIKKPQASFTYFIQDSKKTGGQYVTITDKVKKINEYDRKIILENNTIININEIIHIEF